MAGFTITSPSTAITLDQAGHGSATFTVTNQTGRDLRARAAVAPIEPAVAEWFAIDGETERELRRDGSESFTVGITAPTSTEPGPRSFRLDVASVDRPDDEWAHGPIVGFDLSAGAPIAPGYIETIMGALAGSGGAIVLVVVTGLLLWAASRVPGNAIGLGFLPALSGSFVAAVALGGAIGIFAALVWRTIARPEPSETAIVYVIAALVLGTVLAILPAAFAPQPSASLTNTTKEVTTTDVYVAYKSLPPYIICWWCVSPPPSRPPAATPEPLDLPATPTLTLPLVLIAALLAAVVARASTRWRTFGRL